MTVAVVLFRGKDNSDDHHVVCSGPGCDHFSSFPPVGPWMTLLTMGDIQEWGKTEYFCSLVCLCWNMAGRAGVEVNASTTDPDRARRFADLEEAMMHASSSVQVVTAEHVDPATVNFMLWSTRHQAWWRPAGRGYTTSLDEAGAFDADEAATETLRGAFTGNVDEATVPVVDYRPQLATAAAIEELARGEG